MHCGHRIGNLPTAQSRNVGAVRMTGRYVTADPVSPGEREAMAQGILEILGLVTVSLKGQSYGRIYGIGGTLTTAAAMAQRMTVYDPAAIQHYFVTDQALEALVNQVFSLSQQRRLLPVSPNGPMSSPQAS